MSLFQQGEFVLASGLPSKFKIDCDALTKDDWATLAAMVVPHLNEFGYVYGVPTGGEAFAEALRPYADTGSGCVLFADDVWTTGGSMQKHIRAVQASLPLDVDTGFHDLPNGGSWMGTAGVVAFARTSAPGWVRAVFQCSL